MTTAAPPMNRDADYLDRAERHAGRRLGHRGELSAMLRAAADPSLAADFDRALFLAKFWEGATAVIRRTGPGAEEVVKLTGELSAAAGELGRLVVRLLAAGAPDDAERYGSLYSTGGLAGMERLAKLVADLALLKNFELHGDEG